MSKFWATAVLMSSLLLAVFSSAIEAQVACPTVTTAGEPQWFLLRSFWSPQPVGTLTLTVNVPALNGDCTGLPKEINVPNQQPVTVNVIYPGSGVKCTMGLTHAALTSTSGLPDLIGAFAKVGPFAAVVPPPAPNPLSSAIPPVSSQVVTAAVKCTDTVNPPTTTLVQNIQITYRTPMRLTASLGFVVARGVPAYGVKTMVTGTANGVITTQNTVAVTSLPSAQVVPFTFANIYLIGSQKKHIDAQLGFGVNPNLSTPKVEAFASLFALSLRDIYLSPGIHIGQHEQLANGFAVGNVLPSGVSKLPLSWKVYCGFGFSVSYNLHSVVSGGK